MAKYGPKPIDPTQRFMAKLVATDNLSCWEWTGAKNNKGYGMFMLESPNKIPASRAAWILFRDQIPEGYSVCHHCDNPGCVNPEHLFLGTHADNMHDMHHKGRHKYVVHRGSNNGVAKLDEAKVSEIKRMLRAKVPHKTIAKMFGVASSGISHIATGRNWRHVA
jgi:hypothetical protein